MGSNPQEKLIQQAVEVAATVIGLPIDAVKVTAKVSLRVNLVKEKTPLN